MSPICKMADNGRLTVDQKVKVVLFYAETKRVVESERRFRAHFDTRSAILQTGDIYHIFYELHHSLACLQHWHYDVTILMEW
jgi:hypothetical protein